MPRVLGPSLYNSPARAAAAAAGAQQPVVPYGRTTVVPSWLSKMAVESVVHDFGSGGGLNGTGVHLVGGLVLTAGHVAHQWLPQSVRYSDKAFVGDVRMDHGMNVRFLPEQGSFYGTSRPRFGPNKQGSWNDYAVLSIESKRTVAGIAEVRATGSLSAGEPVWVLGKKTGASFLISEGTFGRVDGNNAIVENIAVAGGFSGGPVLDRNGALVGIAVAQMPDGNCYLVTTETIAKALRRSWPDSDAARVFSKVAIRD